MGGHAELKVQLTPSAILKFDTKIQVAIKGGRTLELRMGGNVEPPTVDIDVVRTDEIFITRNVKIKDFTEMNYSFLIASNYKHLVTIILVLVIDPQSCYLCILK